MRNGRLKPAGYVLPLHIEQLEEGHYIGRSPKLPGLNVQGDSIAEVLRLAPKIAQSLPAAMRTKGIPLPRGLVAAMRRLREGIASMDFRSTGPYPARDELHGRV